MEIAPEGINFIPYQEGDQFLGLCTEQGFRQFARSLKNDTANAKIFKTLEI